jgi:hypothetical protein
MTDTERDQQARYTKVDALNDLNAIAALVTDHPHRYGEAFITQIHESRFVPLRDYIAETECAYRESSHSSGVEPQVWHGGPEPVEPWGKVPREKMGDQLDPEAYCTETHDVLDEVKPMDFPPIPAGRAMKTEQADAILNQFGTEYLTRELTRRAQAGFPEYRVIHSPQVSECNDVDSRLIGVPRAEYDALRAVAEAARHDGHDVRGRRGFDPNCDVCVALARLKEVQHDSR